MAKKKAITKKKIAPKKKGTDKIVVTVSKPDSIVMLADEDEIEDTEIDATDTVTAIAGVIPVDEDEVPVVILETDLIIELCGPGKRCRQRVDGKFIRQNFIAGRWQQVSGTVFSTLEACKIACGG
jgi:hypothetical protein